MINLKSIAVNTKEVDVEYPGIPGFVLTVRHISRPKSKEILTGAQKSVLVNGRAIQELDQDKFNHDFINAALVKWKGLTIGALDQLMLINTEGLDPADPVEYNIDNAMTLMSNSQAFEDFINTTVFSLDQFRTYKSEATA